MIESYWFLRYHCANWWSRKRNIRLNSNCNTSKGPPRTCTKINNCIFTQLTLGAVLKYKVIGVRWFVEEFFLCFFYVGQYFYLYAYIYIYLNIWPVLLMIYDVSYYYYDFSHQSHQLWGVFLTIFLRIGKVFYHKRPLNWPDVVEGNWRKAKELSVSKNVGF